MPLPNFLIIGAQKAGTTWLAKNLQMHPDVFLYKNEIHYFDSKRHFEKSIDWYKSHFDGVSKEIAVGEKTPEYLWVHENLNRNVVPDVHKRIHEVLPDAKLIMVLRNPVERVISSLNHMYYNKYISPLYGPDDYLFGSKCYLLKKRGIIEKGLYYKSIQAYRELYASDQMLVLIFEEDVVQNPDESLRKVCQFLGIAQDYSFKRSQDKIHASKTNRLGLILDYYLPFLSPVNRKISHLFPVGKLRPSAEVIDDLYKIYEEPNEKLFELLGRRIEAWSPRT